MMTFFKWLRVVAAISIFCALSRFFVVIDKDTRNLHALAQIQFTQAVYAGIAGIAVVWIIVSFLFGRIYCSAICPVGVIQDVFSRIAKLVRGKKRKFRFRPAMTKTRWMLLALFMLGLLHVFPLFVTILDPFSNYGRIVSATARPVYRKANDLLAKREHAKKNYDTAFRIVDDYARRVQSPELIIALVALGVIGTLATLYGRRYCNTICPVGTILGLASRHSLFRVRLKHNCIACGVCAAACKGECIDAKSKTVDASRCVACFNCLPTCKRDAIVYALPLQDEVREKREVRQETTVIRHALPAANPRRSFMHWSVFSLLVPVIAGLLAKKAKGATLSLSHVSKQGEGHVPYKKTLPVIPPGARSIKRFKDKCTGCHLCVSKCPYGIITPSTFELGLSGFMQPILRFEHHYCEYECNLCTTVCPTHALQPLILDEKRTTGIGKAVFVKENCVVHTMSENCASCDEHCSTKAIKMVPYGDPKLHLVIPSVERELCIGCGACEYACPIRPYRGIYVDGLAEHEKSQPAFDPDAKQEDISTEIDFPF